MTPPTNELTAAVSDRAREWVNEHHPDCTEAEHAALLADACAEIAALDAQADQNGH